MSVEDIDYVEFLGVLAKGMVKKHKREIMLSCDLTGLLDRQGIGGGSWYQIVTNDNELMRKSMENRSDCWIDREFKQKLRTNIKEHISDKVYNFLVMKSMDESSNLKDLLNYTGWEVLELLLETVSHESDFRRFFIKINKESLEIIPTERHNKTNNVRLNW